MSIAHWLPLLAALSAGALAGSPDPDATIAADGDRSFRELFGAGTSPDAQYVPLRRVADAVASEPAVAPLRDDRASGDGGVPVTQAGLSDGARAWGFVLAGDTLVAADTAPQYRLLDALDVRTDPGGHPSFETMWLGRGRPALLVTNAHFNSQEGFAQHMLVALVDGRLQPVWDGPLLYSVQTGDDDCDIRRIEQMPANFRASETIADQWPDLHVGFRELAWCEKDGVIRERPPAKLFTTTLHWDDAAGRYVGTLPELDALNRERMGLDQE